MDAQVFQYQVRAQPVQFTGDPAINLDNWEPEYPSFIWTTFFLQTGISVRSFLFSGDPIPDLSAWIGNYPDQIFRTVLPSAAHQYFALDVEPRLAPAVPEMSWQQSYPDWMLYQRTAHFPAWSSHVVPIATVPPVLVSRPDFISGLREQTTGSYVALLRDEVGAPISPFTLTAMLLTLYVVDATGTVTYLRRNQNVLNANDVRIYDTLQTRADGKQYNLKWSIQPADTTLVTDLPYERHIALFTYQWPTGKIGRHEVVLTVQNLKEV